MPDAAPPPLQLQLDQQLCFPLYAASHLLTRLYRPLLRTLGLTYPQYLVMLVLWEHGSSTVGALGERLHLDSGTLTPLLKRLEAAALIVRQREAGDERRVRVRLTDAGTALRLRALDVPHALSCRIAGGVQSPTGTDLAAMHALRASLQALVARLDRAAHASPDDAASPERPDLPAGGPSTPTT